MCLRQQPAAPSLELKLAVISVQNGTFEHDDKTVAASSTLDPRGTSKRNNANVILLKACRKVKKLCPDLHVTQCALKASHVTIHGHHA